MMLPQTMTDSKDSPRSPQTSQNAESLYGMNLEMVSIASPINILIEQLQ